MKYKVNFNDSTGAKTIEADSYHFEPEWVSFMRSGKTLLGETYTVPVASFRSRGVAYIEEEKES